MTGIAPFHGSRTQWQLILLEAYDAVLREHAITQEIFAVP